MNEHLKNNKVLRTAGGSVMVGLGAYFILSAICVMFFWFTKVPESMMTYAGGFCLAGGCFAAGIKMGRGMGKRGMLSGVVSGMLISGILWVMTWVISGGNMLMDPSVIKLVCAVICGATGGMVGVNK